MVRLFLCAFIAALAFVAPPATAQTIYLRDSLPPGVAATVVTATDGTVLQAPVMACSNCTSSSGGVPSLDEANTLAGRGFSWGTGVQTVAANNYLNVVFANPAGSGKSAYVILREFGNGTTTVLQAVLRTNCTAPGGSTVVAGGNRMMSSSTAAVSTLAYSMSTTPISTGTTGPALMLEINGAQNDSTLLRMVPPGQSFCYVISGLTGAFAASAQVSFSIAGWEQ